MTSSGPRPRSASAGCRTSWRLACSTACSLAAAALLAGCGASSPPKLARADAAPLIALAGRISGEGACAQARDIAQLQRRAIALVNAHRVPAGLQEPLVSGVNDLAGRAPLCLPAVHTTPTRAPTTPQPPRPGRKHPHPHPPRPGPPPHGPGHGHGHGPGHDHGPGKGGDG